MQNHRGRGRDSRPGNGFSDIIQPAILLLYNNYRSYFRIAESDGISIILLRYTTDVFE